MTSAKPPTDDFTAKTFSKYNSSSFDGESNRMIAHWMDNFGAACSIPRGEGGMAGNVITLDGVQMAWQ